VINKPAGLVVHPGSGNWSGTLDECAAASRARHRGSAAGRYRASLDKDTSGLLVVAKTLEAQTDLVRQLQARTVQARLSGPGGRAMKSRSGTVERRSAATRRSGSRWQWCPRTGAASRRLTEHPHP
jgi:23S rRNA pseudouridine1911/1915/1917 synthase